MNVPPPKASPQVPRDGGDIEPTTGVFPATRDFVRHAAFWSTLKAVGAVVVAIVVGAILGWERIGTMAEGRGALKAAELEPRLAAVEQLRVEVYDLRKELRSFYDWQTTGRPMVLAPMSPPRPVPDTKDSGR